jgi:hypothetical protein
LIFCTRGTVYHKFDKLEGDSLGAYIARVEDVVTADGNLGAVWVGLSGTFFADDF